MGTETALLISPHGLDATEQDALTQVLNMLATDGLQFQLQSDNVQKAHLVILDDETEPGKNALLRARTGQVKLVFSTQSRSGKNIISVKKPINLQSLRTLLVKICQKMYDQLQLQTTASAPPAQAAESETSDTKEASSDSSLFTVLLDAKQQQQHLRIEIPGFAEMYVNGNSKSFATHIEQNDLKKIFSVDFGQINVTPIDEATFNSQTGDMLISALYRLLWISGIYGSQGQLINGHNRQTPVKLRAWPNFTRNDFLPQHLKLAAILARQPTTIEQLAETTGISQIDIVNFYNAAYAVDLIEFSLTEEAESVQPAPPATNAKRRSILSKLAARLKLAT